uniref:Uncharacterized protein n=1 Tax=Arundo donax TaxID=35708 RepID=A0A0A9HLB9_ARUDO
MLLGPLFGLFESEVTRELQL